MAASLGLLIPELQGPAQDLIAIAQEAGVSPRVTSTLRSTTEQARLYRRWQAGASRFPAAPPGTSAHEYGFAFDLVVNGEDNLADLGQVWQSMGGVWSPSDPIHFQYPGFRPPKAQPTVSPWRHRIAVAADFLLAWNPYIGAVELAASLLRLGFPRSEVLAFLSEPLETIEAATR